MGAQGNPGDGAGLIRAFIEQTLMTSSLSVFSGNMCFVLLMFMSVCIMFTVLSVNCKV